jgi:hypothetical protein
VVKLASGDPSWHNLGALAFHYETQPLPTPIAWYVSQFPDTIHRATTALVLAIELIVPWFVFGPRRIRHAACATLLGLQAAIALTGNYAFFNLLSAALCLLLIDDAAFGRLRGETAGASTRHLANARAWSTMRQGIAWVFAVTTIPLSVYVLAGQLGLTLPGAPAADRVARAIAPFRALNRYGLFAVMTTTRPEIVVEGSDDGVAWAPYEFRYKPGDVHRPPHWVAPFQPRLDWLMWFAALGEYEQEVWFRRFCERLLAGSPPVLALLGHDPFAGRPPRFVRAVLYRYEFTDRTAADATAWWSRVELGPYSPVLRKRRVSSSTQF